MGTQILTIEIPEDEDVEVVIEQVVEWLQRGMTSGYYPTWRLRDELPEPEAVAQRVLDNHVIRDDWKRNGAQVRQLIAEAIRIERGEQ